MCGAYRPKLEINVSFTSYNTVVSNGQSNTKRTERPSLCINVLHSLAASLEDSNSPGSMVKKTSNKSKALGPELLG